MNEEKTSDKFEQWCIVEVMGHSTYAGFVTEQTIAGQAFVRVDVPEVESRDWRGDLQLRPAFTKLLGGSSIYAITPCTERAAIEAAKRLAKVPHTAFDWSQQPAALPSMYDDE